VNAPVVVGNVGKTIFVKINFSRDFFVGKQKNKNSANIFEIFQNIGRLYRFFQNVLFFLDSSEY
jgi:hypothetical protein